MNTEYDGGPGRSPQSNRATSQSWQRRPSATPSTPSLRSTPFSPEVTFQAAVNADDEAGPATKRKRGITSVIDIACNACRQKRTKCTGEQPTCSRCEASKIVCVYTKPAKVKKQELRDDVERLRKYHKSSETVLAALSANEEDDVDQLDETLRRLQQGEDVGKIALWLDDLALGSPRLSGMPTSGNAAPSTSKGSTSGVIADMRMDLDPTSAPSSNRTRSQIATDTAAGSSRSMQGLLDTGQSKGKGKGKGKGLASENSMQLEYQQMAEAPLWDNVNADRELIAHLIMQYIVWEYPTFATMSKEHFLHDYRQGNPRFCSSLLLNAILALGARFSLREDVRPNPEDPMTAGDGFFREAKRLLALEPLEYSVTTVQALGVMSVRESGCGRDSESWYYAGQSMRLALEMGLHENFHDARYDEDMRAVRIATFWGAFALDHAWSLATGILPQCSETCILPPKPAILPELEGKIWYPYTNDGPPISIVNSQAAYTHAVHGCFCELSELAHKSLYAMYSPGRLFTSQELLKARAAFGAWYESMPASLRLGANYTPSMLFVHMFYHFSVLLLFRPLIKLRIIGSEISPRRICLEAADAILTVMDSYHRLYSLRRTPSFVPYLVLTASVMHLALSALPRRMHLRSGAPVSRDVVKDIIRTSQAEQDEGRAQAAKNDATAAVNKGLGFLTEMAPSHAFAGRALLILKFLARKWHIDFGDEHNSRSSRDSSSGSQSGNYVGGASSSNRSVAESTQSFRTGRIRAPGSMTPGDAPNTNRSREERHQPGLRTMLGSMRGQTSSIPSSPAAAAAPTPPPHTSAPQGSAHSSLSPDVSGGAGLSPMQDSGTRPSSESRNFFATDFTEHDWTPGPLSSMFDHRGSFSHDMRRESIGGISGISGIHNASLSGSGISARSSSGGVASSPMSTDRQHLPEGAAPAEKPLFWPFPMQARPIMPSREGLRDAGFELL